MFGIVLACGVPAGATALDCTHTQQSGTQKPEAPAQRGAQPGAPQTEGDRPRRDPWWKAAGSRAELGLTDQQSKEIDDIFQATRPALKAAKDELDKLDEAVARLIKEGSADWAVVNRQVTQAEQARAKLTTARTVMLYRMHRLLTPEQRAKLDAMFARWDAERRKSNPPKDRD